MINAAAQAIRAARRIGHRLQAGCQIDHEFQAQASVSWRLTAARTSALLNATRFQQTRLLRGTVNSCAMASAGIHARLCRRLLAMSTIAINPLAR